MRSKLLLLTISIMLILSSCGDTVKRSKTTWTDVNAAMKHSTMASRETVSKQTEETTTKEIQTQRTDKTIVTNVTTESTVSSEIQPTDPVLQMADPSSLISFTVPQGWASGYENGTIILQNSSGEFITINAYYIESAVTEEDVYNFFINNYAETMILGQTTTVNGWYVTEMYDSQSAYKVYYTIVNNYLMSIFMSAGTDDASLNSLMNSMFLM